MEGSSDANTQVQNLSDSFQTAVQLGGGMSASSDAAPSSTIGVLMPPSALPQFSMGGTSLVSSTGTSLLPPGPIPTQPSYITPPPPLVNVGPPPKAGFQPVPHPVQSQPMQAPAAAVTNNVPGQVEVNMFTPTFDSNSPLSHYSQPPPPPQMQPPQSGSMHNSFDMSRSLSEELARQGYDRSTWQHIDATSFIEWLKQNQTLQKYMQKAKTGVQTVITTMDPQMKDVLYSGGDISIVVCSSKPVKYDPVKEAFQQTFGRATVNAYDSQPTTVAPQPIGFNSGIQGCEERILNLRNSGKINPNQVCVAVESFIVDLQQDQWYDIAALVLSDPVNSITLKSFSQPTPINTEHVNQAKFETPKDFPLSSTGISITIGQILQRQLNVNPSDWHSSFGGISRQQLIHMAATQLANLYQQMLPPNA